MKSRTDTPTRHASSQKDGAPPWQLQCGELSLISASAEQIFADGVDFLEVVPVNAEVFVLAHENRRFNDLLRTTVNTVDGRVLQWICSLLYGGKRVNLLKGANFIFDLADWCRTSGEKLFLLGSTEESNAGAVAALRGRYPGLVVDGFGPPLTESPFEEPHRRTILERIERHRPHHLAVCFGAPKQEFWIAENATALAGLGVRRAYCMGGTIDFVSGTRPRAPQWVQFIGAEWFFRFLSEPRARFLRTLTMFKMPLYAMKTFERRRTEG